MKIRMSPAAAITAAIMAFALVSCQKSGVQAAREEANTPGTSARNSLSLDDQAFLIEAERDEVRQQTLAQKILEKDVDPQVYKYAQRMAADRAGALHELLDLMKKKGVNPPFSVSDVQIEAAGRLDLAPGKAFDHEFVSLMAAELQQVVSNFRLASETAGDADIRAYATRLVPSLEADRQKAADLEKKLAKPDREAYPSRQP
jgi:putative membrane protein